VLANGRKCSKASLALARDREKASASESICEVGVECYTMEYRRRRSIAMRHVLFEYSGCDEKPKQLSTNRQLERWEVERGVGASVRYEEMHGWVE